MRIDCSTCEARKRTCDGIRNLTIHARLEKNVFCNLHQDYIKIYGRLRLAYKRNWARKEDVIEEFLGFTEEKEA